MAELVDLIKCLNQCLVDIESTEPRGHHYLGEHHKGKYDAFDNARRNEKGGENFEVKIDHV